MVLTERGIKVFAGLALFTIAVLGLLFLVGLSFLETDSSAFECFGTSIPDGRGSCIDPEAYHSTYGGE